MIPATYDLSLYAGATFKQKLNLKDNTGAAINVTGYTFRMMVRRPSAYGPVVLQFNSGSVTPSATQGVIDITNAATGTIELQMAASYTTGLKQMTGVYDLEMESPTGEVSRLMGGKFIVVGEVTR